MKRNIFVSLASLILFFFISTNTNAATPAATAEESAKAVKSEKVESAEAKAIMARLEEIKSMDKSHMTSREKKELRKEVRVLRTQMAEIGGGVYISAGALIVILLLILLL